MPAEKVLAEYAKSCVYVSRFHYEMRRDLDFAKELLEKVAGSNAEDANEAAELLKKVNTAIAAQAADAAHEMASAEKTTVRV